MNIKDLQEFQKLTNSLTQSINESMKISPKNVKVLSAYNFKIAKPIKKGYQSLVNILLDNFKNNISTVDEAFLNSILSFSTYDRNGWMIRTLSSDFSDITPTVQQAMKTSEGMYSLKVWHFMKNTFEKIPDHKLKIPREKITTNAYGYKTHFSYFNGEYNAANGLAHATVLTSKHPSGTGNILHLSFRGTEFSRLREYLTGAYLDMTAYYQHFKPLEEYLKQYAKDPNNNIVELHVNGHSLGGAMVQQFLNENPKESFPVPIKGFTFGSPGSNKKWHSKFLTLAFHAIRKIKVPTSSKPIENDPRITEFYHGNDPVPIIGLIGYKKSGNTRKLRDTAYKESKAANLESTHILEKIPAFGKLMTFFKENILFKFNTKFHDSARYIMNLRNQIEQYYVEHPHLGGTLTANTKHWQHWIKQENTFGTLSIRYKNAFEYLVQAEDPELNPEQVNDKVLQIREKMKYDSPADAILAKTRKESEAYTNFLSPSVELRDDPLSLVTLTYRGKGVKETVEKIRALEKIELTPENSKKKRKTLLT